MIISKTKIDVSEGTIEYNDESICAMVSMSHEYEDGKSIVQNGFGEIIISALTEDYEECKIRLSADQRLIDGIELIQRSIDNIKKTYKY